jgi:TatD DNase family protein
MQLLELIEPIEHFKLILLFKNSSLLINIHTHKPHNNDEWSIQNLHAHFEKLNPLFNYSVGLHPWHIDSNTVKEELVQIKVASWKKNVLAIGECGLDRICSTDFKLQEKVFIEQILWANEIAKPLIIHCVKAHHETLVLLKEYSRSSPVIFHGFNNKLETANKILEQGYYLSFGKHLFNPAIENIFSKISLEKIFLETDDSDAAIDNIYKQAAKIKNMSTEQLSLQIKKNLENILKKTKF